MAQRSRPARFALVLVAGGAIGVGADRLLARPNAPAVEPASAPEAPPPTGVTVRGLADADFLGVLLSSEAVELTPRAEGRVEEIYVQPGDRVKRGAPIAKL